MNRVEAFERKMGGRWTGVAFNKSVPDDVRMVDKPVHFCEAIQRSSTGSFLLTRDTLNCVGARRCFGWEMNSDPLLVEKIASHRQELSHQSISVLLKQIPKLIAGSIKSITVGTYDSPDVLISYVQPESAMRFVQQWQNVYLRDLDVSISSIMAVCGSVAVASYTTGRVCCSFGCPESRSHGSIGRDRLVIGVPVSLIDDFIQK